MAGVSRRERLVRTVLERRGETDFPPFMPRSDEEIQAERRRLGLEPPLHTELGMEMPPAIRKMVRDLITEQKSEYPPWLRKGGSKATMLDIWKVVPEQKTGKARRPTMSSVPSIEVDPEGVRKAMEGRSELLKQRRQVEIANNRIRFRQRWGREPVGEEVWTGRPGPIGGR
jgi:hypothetical protein